MKEGFKIIPDIPIMSENRALKVSRKHNKNNITDKNNMIDDTKGDKHDEGNDDDNNNCSNKDDDKGDSVILMPEDKDNVKGKNVGMNDDDENNDLETGNVVETTEKTKTKNGSRRKSTRLTVHQQKEGRKNKILCAIRNGK